LGPTTESTAVVSHRILKVCRVGAPRCASLASRARSTWTEDRFGPKAASTRAWPRPSAYYQRLDGTPPRRRTICVKPACRRRLALAPSRSSDWAVRWLKSRCTCLPGCERRPWLPKRSRHPRFSATHRSGGPSSQATMMRRGPKSPSRIRLFFDRLSRPHRSAPTPSELPFAARGRRTTGVGTGATEVAVVLTGRQRDPAKAGWFAGTGVVLPK